MAQWEHYFQVATHLADNPKTGQIIAGVTVASGVSTWADWLPTDLGKIATFVGIVLSLVVIYVTIQRERRERRRAELEQENLRMELAERKRRAAERRERGLPARRLDDEE